MKIAEFLEQISGHPYQRLPQVEFVGPSLTVNETYTNEDGHEAIRSVKRKLGSCEYDKICLALMASECRDLKTIVLQDQNLHFQHLADIHLIISKNRNLAVLNLDSNPFVWNTAARNFLQSFLNTSSLVELSIRKCGLTDAALLTIAEALKVNKSLQKLYIGKKQQFSLAAYDLFVQMLTDNTSLIQCDIDLRTIHFVKHAEIKKRLNIILSRNRGLQDPAPSSAATMVTDHATSSTSSTATTSVTIDLAEAIANLEENVLQTVRTNRLRYSSHDIARYIVSALQVLQANDWSKVVAGSHSCEIPPDVITVLDSYIKQNPIFFSSHNYPGTVKRMCANLLSIEPAVSFIEEYIFDCLDTWITAMGTITLNQQRQLGIALQSLPDQVWIPKMSEAYYDTVMVEFKEFIKNNPVILKVVEFPKIIIRVCSEVLDLSGSKFLLTLMRENEVYHHHSSARSFFHRDASSATTVTRVNTRKSLIKTAHVWVHTLTGLGYCSDDAVLYVIAALQALQENQWHRLLRYPAEVILLLEEFVDLNPILRKASEHPHTVRKICMSLSDMLYDTASSESSFRTNNS